MFVKTCHVIVRRVTCLINIAVARVTCLSERVTCLSKRVLYRYLVVLGTSSTYRAKQLTAQTFFLALS